MKHKHDFTARAGPCRFNNSIIEGADFTFTDTT
jgi:hypothetical protein